MEGRQRINLNLLKPEVYIDDMTVLCYALCCRRVMIPAQ